MYLLTNGLILSYLIASTDWPPIHRIESTEWLTLFGEKKKLMEN